ncbi:RNA helicase [Floricoccus penangensis]|uniref:RNA helicase n=2 Tax=Floricoccus penangensis TaxID=1859475 RepID=A0A9Q5JGS5_9LACT|nr:RNA helicase [Floricoccus penangensis]
MLELNLRLIKMIDKNTLPEVWQTQLEELGFNEFTAVQEESFEPLKDGMNVIATSPTGTGKTLAYLLPLLLNVKKGAGQQLLILAPNSELAGQIHDVTKTWAEPLGLKASLVIAGASLKRQIERLKKAPEIVIATPGRALELVKDKKIKMTAINTIVLDEVDQLVEDGQFNFVKPIINRTPKDYQFAFYSATADSQLEKIQQIAENKLSNLVEINVTETDSNVEHIFVEVEKRKKVDFLRQLAHLPNMRGLVFFNKLDDLGNAEQKLQYQGIDAQSLASDVGGRFRKVLLDKFKNGEITLLLATDLLARGIDIENLDYVINFDVPVTEESYLHRAGRTGRMGKDGTVLSIISSPIEKKNLKKLANDPQEKILKAQKFVDKK